MDLFGQKMWGVFGFCPKMAFVSDVVWKKVGEKFVERQEKAISLYRQKSTATLAKQDSNGIRQERTQGTGTCFTRKAGTVTNFCKTNGSLEPTFNSDVIVDGDGNQYRFADNLEHKQAYTFEIWNVLPDAHLESFTEFQYFTCVTDIPPFAFYRFKKLKSICLPPSIKTIGHRAFYGCVSLQNIESEAPIEDVLKIKL